jgi:hypothetical protein
MLSSANIRISKPVFGINAAYPTLNNNQPINQSYLDVGHTDDSAVKFLKCADHPAPPSELSTPTLIYRLNVLHTEKLHPKAENLILFLTQGFVLLDL